MREILFRGKRTDNGEWVYGYVAETTVSGASGSKIATVIYKKPRKPYDDDWWEIDPSTVGQYTGLTDKYGVKIFEGDIVKYYDNLVETDYTAVVKFGKYEQDGSDGEYEPTECIGFYVEVDSYFTWNYIYGWEPCSYSLQRSLLEVAKSCEVIGNIHDNPELLKGGKRA